MRFTTAASSGTMIRSSPSHLYPKILKCPFGMPRSNRFFILHLQLSEMLLLSSCANEARMESISSPSPSMERMFSRSNQTSTPISFRCRTVSSRSTVLRAKREMLFVSTRSIFPASQSAIILLKPSRLAVPVPEMPLSEYTPANTQSGFFWIFSL